MNNSLLCFVYAACLMLIMPALSEGDVVPVEFKDMVEQVGLSEILDDWQLAHGGAWGDVTGNGRPDLYIGAFADRPVYADTEAPIPNMLLLNRDDGFVLSPDVTIRFDARGEPTEKRSRTAMVLFADLNNNNKLDLLVGNHAQRKSPESRLFKNRWPEDFLDVTPDGECGWPEHFDMRNATAVDLNHNGLLDLILIDGRYRGEGRRPLALLNRGDFTFEDVSEEIGFPREDAYGLGLGIGDVNNNGRLDFFIPHSNRMLISRPDGTYREYRPGYFREPEFSSIHAWPCGAAFADLTGNGLLDLVFTVHGVPPQIFIYVNRGIDRNGMPDYENVTEAAGLDLPYPARGIPASGKTGSRGISLRAAHLGLVDVDNNGRRDILLGMTYRNENGRIQPVVFRNEETRNGVPRFSTPPVKNWVGYYCVAPIADYDRDGRLDIFLGNWHEELESYLFRNVTEGGNYLAVRVNGEAEDLNNMGIGAVVRVYSAGNAGDPEHLLGRHDIVVGSGYASGEEALAHFGLGNAEYCDVVVSWQGYKTVLQGIEANRYITVSVGSEQ